MESQSSKRRLSARDKEIDALNLRRKGYTYREIAAVLQCHPATVYQTVKRAMTRLLQELNELAEEVMLLEQERLDSYLVALQPGIEDGDVKSILAAVKISERRCKLLGLDKAVPQKVEVANTDEQDVLQQILGRLNTRDEQA